ncbi:MAG TPA: MBL fold metallo-hydrolase [Stellaceae bacterium]|nr:MBL fold metallo-hydrolase [Stellaceae bacterium]
MPGDGETPPKTNFSATFWGVRGSIPCPGEATIRYGGNTACLEVCCGQDRLIFDAGTGLRPLGMKLMEEPGPHVLDIFLSHTHYDHVGGLPFFVPAFVPGNTIRLWAGNLKPELCLKQVLAQMMAEPLFPVPIEALRAVISYTDFDVGTVLEPRPGIRLSTAPLNHPNRATGYRIDYAGKSICYVTDTEHPASGLDMNILKLIERADYVIYDAMYTAAEYPHYRDWGHSTWEAGIRLVEAAGAKHLVVFHHSPKHDDAAMDEIAAAAARARHGTLVAREGMILTP